MVHTTSSVLSGDSVARLAIEYSRSRDGILRDELVVAHRGLARWAAGKFGNRGEPLEDLEQVAMMGLLAAIDRFDPAMGRAQFSSYAVATMLGELKRHFRDHSWRVHLPRSLHDRHLLVQSTMRSLTEESGRSPTIAELGQQARISVEQVVEAMEVGSRGRPASLEATDAAEHLESDPSLGAQQPEMTEVENRADVTALLGRLSPRDRTVVYLRFVQDMSQAEIGRRVGVSQMQISRILTRSLLHLRELATEGGGMAPAHA